MNWYKIHTFPFTILPENITRTFPARIVPEEVKDELLDFISSMSPSDVKIEMVKEIEIQIPDVVTPKASVQQIHLNGLDLLIPSSDIEHLLSAVRVAEEEKWKESRFYRIPTLDTLLFLTPKHRKLLVEKLAEILPEVRKVVKAEYQISLSKLGRFPSGIRS